MDIEAEEKKTEPVFQDLNEELQRMLSSHQPPPLTYSIAVCAESLCMNCGDNGITKFLLTKIPYFRGKCPPIFLGLPVYRDCYCGV